MKKALKLILFYFLLQIPAIPFAWVLGMGYSYLKCGAFEWSVAETVYTPLILVLGTLFLALYLWKMHYVTGDPQLFSPLTPSRMGWCLLAGVSAIYLIGVLMSELTFLPNWFETTFDILQSGWWGIIAIAVLGPIVEELLFRGAITKELLRTYSPAKAILISAFIFGIIHGNPIQTVNAFLMGLMLAWLYYKTGSLLPCILLHIANNAFSVYADRCHPEWNEATHLLRDPAAVIAAVIAAGLLWLAIRKINKPHLPTPSSNL